MKIPEDHHADTNFYRALHNDMISLPSDLQLEIVKCLDPHDILYLQLVRFICLFSSGIC